MKVFVSSFLLAGLALTGCAARASHPVPSLEKLAFVQTDGLISLNRSAPPIQTTTNSSMLGFIPTTLSGDRWLSIDRSEGTISLMEGDKVLERATAQGYDSLKAGRYSLLHKQRDPLWYARDEYFAKRNLPIPPEGDKERFRRGALGEFALFVDQDTPIHDGPIWSDDVGGVRLEEDIIKKIYYSVDVGATVEIQ